jgi:hypothetical protein
LADRRSLGEGGQTRPSKTDQLQKIFLDALILFARLALPTKAFISCTSNSRTSADVHVGGQPGTCHNDFLGDKLPRRPFSQVSL